MSPFCYTAHVEDRSYMFSSSERFLHFWATIFRTWNIQVHRTTSQDPETIIATSDPACSYFARLRRKAGADGTAICSLVLRSSSLGRTFVVIWFQILHYKRCGSDKYGLVGQGPVSLSFAPAAIRRITTISDDPALISVRFDCDDRKIYSVWLVMLHGIHIATSTIHFIPAQKGRIGHSFGPEHGQYL